jgi:predicted phage-related endonuclease
MKTLNLVQGSDEWLTARLTYLCASEAPAMMGKSKFMTRNQLLDLKKGWESNPHSSFKEKLFQKGHKHEEMAREVTELEYCEDFPSVVGLTDIGLSVSALSSFDGLNDDGLIWEHKDWNLTLAENVRNNVLEPQYYWQLEHQMLTADVNEALFTCSDGGEVNRVSMLYVSVPERRQELIAGWKQFLVDLESHELKAKTEVIVARKQESFPVIECRVEGSKVISNLGDYIPGIQTLADEQMHLVLESDQDFIDKEAFNKNVKAGRAVLKTKSAEILKEFESLAEFNGFVAQADSILQKLQSHGETQVKNSKTAKKNSIIATAQQALSDYLFSLSETINKVQISQVVVDWVSVMKGKRSFEKMQDAVDTELANAKIEASAIADVIRKNLASLSELASEYKFLFSDHAMLLLKDNDDLINLIKTRISDHEKAEADRLEAQRIQLEKEAAEKAEASRETIRQEEAAKLKAEQDAELAKTVTEQPIAKTVEAPTKQSTAATSIATPGRTRPFAMPAIAKAALNPQQKIDFHDFLEANWDGYEAALIQFNNQKAA